jgi:TonB family protein
MREPHRTVLAQIVLLFWVILLGGLLTFVPAQQPGPSPDAARGIQLYQQGDTAGAVKVLEQVVKRHPEDASAQYYLGLAYYRQGFIGEARRRLEGVIELWPDSAEAHAKLAYGLIIGNQPEKAWDMAQRAIELGDQSAESHYVIAEANLRRRTEVRKPGKLEVAISEADAALRIKTSFTPALITKSFALFYLKRYSEAATCLEEFIAMRPDDVDADTWREQVEELRERASKSGATLEAAEPTILNGKTVTQRARVLAKPEPSYTEAARMVGLQGTVVLRAVFGSDGTVKRVVVHQALGYGMTFAAVTAARLIRFTPAQKDGVPVSTWMQLEYNFNLY